MGLWHTVSSCIHPLCCPVLAWCLPLGWQKVWSQEASQRHSLELFRMYTGVSGPIGVLLRVGTDSQPGQSAWRVTVQSAYFGGLPASCAAGPASADAGCAAKHISQNPDGLTLEYSFATGDLLAFLVFSPPPSSPYRAPPGILESESKRHDNDCIQKITSQSGTSAALKQKYCRYSSHTACAVCCKSILIASAVLTSVTP